MRPQYTGAETIEIFRTVLEQVWDCSVFLLDQEGRVISWNDAARRIEGYEAAEILGKHFSIFYLPEAVQVQKPQMALQMALEKGSHLEERWLSRKDGSRFLSQIIIIPRCDVTQRVIGFAILIRKVKYEGSEGDNFGKRYGSEERFRLLVEQVKDYAIFMLDTNGNVASWNQGAMRIKGYTAEEILGKHFSTFYSPEDQQRNYPAHELESAVQNGRYEDEGWRVRKDGSRFWANVVITALHDQEGNHTGFAKVTRDLTQRKNAEDLLRQKSEELEAFAHTLSHDLRAPLRTIHGFANILKDDSGELTAAQKDEYLDKIINASQSMEILINGVLKVTRLNSATAEAETVDLEDILKESLSLLEAEIQETNAAITIRNPLPRVKANRTLLVQIFSNLLANALKFVRKGSTPKVEVFAVPRNGTCEIHVKDSGIGIPERHRQSIFNLFDRGSASAETSGTGIGLAIVRKAVQRIGGIISVQSSEDEGSDFIIQLPAEHVQK